jgi:hypothetical protein
VVMTALGEVVKASEPHDRLRICPIKARRLDEASFAAALEPLYAALAKERQGERTDLKSKTNVVAERPPVEARPASRPPGRSAEAVAAHDQPPVDQVRQRPYGLP